MQDVERYQILVVGSGEAGKYLAWTMAKAVIGPRWSSADF